MLGWLGGDAQYDLTSHRSATADNHVAIMYQVKKERKKIRQVKSTSKERRFKKAITKQAHHALCTQLHSHTSNQALKQQITDAKQFHLEQTPL